MVSPRVRRIATKLALHHLRRQVADPALRERLTPDFELGCKRILISNDWYPAVSAPNVEVVSAACARCGRTRWSPPTAASTPPT